MSKNNKSTAKNLTSDEEVALTHDVRIDRIGFCNELVKHFADPLKTDVKSSMLTKNVSEAEGDFFDAKIIESESSTINPEKFYERFKAGKITLKAFLSAISVNKEAARAALGSEELERISDKGEPTVSLRITRKKGAQIELVDAVKALSDQIGGKSEAA